MEHISAVPWEEWIFTFSQRLLTPWNSAVARIRDLAEELNLRIPVIKLIVNRAPNGELNEGTAEGIEKQGLDLLGVIPMDQQVFEYDAYGKPLVTLPEDSAARKAVREIIDKLEIK